MNKINDTDDSSVVLDNKRAGKSKIVDELTIHTSGHSLHHEEKKACSQLAGLGKMVPVVEKFVYQS